jgi:hypothetical protein
MRERAVIPGRAKRRSGTHNHRIGFGEDWQLPAWRHNISLGLWVPAFAGTTPREW